jgi:hypothetical protein
MEPIDPTAWDMRDPHTHEDMQREDWPLLLLLIIPLAVVFAAGFALGRVWA